MPALYALLARLSPTALRAVAARIGQRLGWSTIPTTAQTLVASIRGAMARNPRTARVVVEALKFGGLTLATNEVVKLFTDDESGPDTRDAILNIAHQAAEEYFSAVAENAANADRIGGDGDPETVHGVKYEEYVEEKSAFVGRIARIRDLAQRHGGFQALIEIREIIALEAADIALAQSFANSRGLGRR